MTTPGFALFDTAIGRCAIAWGPAGIVGLHLPGRDDAAVRARLRDRDPEVEERPAPRDVREVMKDVQRLLNGEARTLSAVVLDMNRVSEFDRGVYALTREIPFGSTMTYGEIATRLGDPLLSRAVGQALGRNPFPIIVPCHRVLAAHGRLGGFSAPGGIITKRRLLEIERARGVHPGLPWEEQAGGPEQEAQ